MIPVPKILGLLREINKEAIIVSFKLETDVEILEKKIIESMKKYNLEYVNQTNIFLSVLEICYLIEGIK